VSYWFSEATVSANAGEWEGDSKPKNKQNELSSERYSGTAAFHQQHQIQQQGYAKHNTET